MEATAPHPDASDSAAAIEDLNAQLEMLRNQLDAAFDDFDARLAAAAALADAADSRAQVASDQAANMFAAVEELTTTLATITETADPTTAQRLRVAVSRLRSRLQPTAGA